MKQKIQITIIILLLITISGCQQNNESEMKCEEPLTAYNDGCCMDANKNSICDITEADYKKEKNAEKINNTIKSDTASNIKNNTINNSTKPNETDSKAQSAYFENTAKLFTEKWNMKQYNIMYTLFTSKIKQKKNATEFSAIMQLDPFYKKIDQVIYQGSKKISETVYEANIVAFTNIQEITIPAVMIEFDGKEWKINAFADVFEMNSYDAACSGYKNNNKYTTKDCAFDFVKKTKDSKYCNVSGCHYIECLKSSGIKTTYKDEAEQCFFCQPTGKTTNECILNVAIKYGKIDTCEVISDEKYSDKYCVCYGGFAKQQNNEEYCNLISNEDNRYLCIKKFNDQYC